MIFCIFPRLRFFFDEFSGRSLETFPSYFFLFLFRAKTADKRNLQYHPSENQYSPRCALAPAPRLRRRRRQKTHAKTTSRNRENQVFSCFFACRQALPQRSSQNDLPEALRDQDDPKRRQERPKKDPGAAPGRPGADQKGLKSLPRLRGASGEPFWNHFGLILEPPEVDFRASGG